MPASEKNADIILQSFQKTEINQYVSLPFQTFSQDVFGDYQKDFSKCVRIGLGTFGEKGKIAVLSGKSGTGKSTFLRQVVSQIDKEGQKPQFLYVPSDNLSILNESVCQDFLKSKNGRRKIVILEDCDSSVCNNPFILNSTDGLISDSFDISYFMTTSKGTLSFRENRIAHQVNFENLSVEKAQEIALKKNPKFNKTKIRESMTISELAEKLDKENDDGK